MRGPGKNVSIRMRSRAKTDMPQPHATAAYQILRGRWVFRYGPELCVALDCVTSNGRTFRAFAKSMFSCDLDAAANAALPIV